MATKYSGGKTGIRARKKPTQRGGRRDESGSVKEALTWSVVWIATSLLFSVFVYFAYANHWLGLGMPHDDQTS